MINVIADWTRDWYRINRKTQAENHAPSTSETYKAIKQIQMHEIVYVVRFDARKHNLSWTHVLQYISIAFWLPIFGWSVFVAQISDLVHYSAEHWWSFSYFFVTQAHEKKSFLFVLRQTHRDQYTCRPVSNRLQIEIE